MSTFTYCRSKYLIVSLAFLLSGLAVIRFGFTAPAGIKTSERNSVAVMKSLFSGAFNTTLTDSGNLKTSLSDQNFQSDVYHYSDDDMFTRTHLSLPRYVRLKK